MPPPQQDEDVARDYRFLKLRLTKVKKSGRQTGLSFVILNAFQDLLTGSKDAKRHRCKASIVNNNSLAPCERAEFQCENGNSNIRNSGEGATHVAKINLIPSLEGRGSKGVGDNHYSSSGTMCHLLPHRGEGIKEILKHGGQSDVQDDENNFLKRTYSPIHLFSYSHRKRAAFTLAEVLITLGIIGVVAAMTMPSLVVNYQKKQTAVRLERFYSIMSQAILRWQQDEGLMPEDMQLPAEAVNNGQKTREWFNSTIGKYMTTVSQQANGQNFSVAFNDGSGFDSYIGGNKNQFFIFYCVDYKYCYKGSGEGNFNGKTGFLFEINKGRLVTSAPHFDTKTREEILEACKYGNSDDSSVRSKGRRHACTRLIQIDGWEIKDDYPWNQTMLEN